MLWIVMARLAEMSLSLHGGLFGGLSFEESGGLSPDCSTGESLDDSKNRLVLCGDLLVYISTRNGAKPPCWTVFHSRPPANPRCFLGYRACMSNTPAHCFFPPHLPTVSSVGTQQTPPSSWRETCTPSTAFDGLPLFYAMPSSILSSIPLYSK